MEQMSPVPRKNCERMVRAAATGKRVFDEATLGVMKSINTN